mgnify:CR=1 FL=1
MRSELKVLSLLGFLLYVGSWIFTFRPIHQPELDPWTSSKSSSSYMPDSEIYKCSTCSWNKYTPNKFFGNLDPLEEFQDVQIPQEFPPILCLPESFGYTHEEASNIFKEVNFPDCRSKADYKEDFLELDIQNNQLKMNCPNGKGGYSLGINPALEQLGKNEYTFELKKYPGHPVELTNNEEYAYGTFSSKTGNFTQDFTILTHLPETVIKRNYKTPGFSSQLMSLTLPCSKQ